jgi:hypothetical protein
MILWRALGGTPEPKPVLTTEERIANLQTALASPFIGKRSKQLLQRDLMNLLDKENSKR